MSTAGELSGTGPRYYAEPRTHKRHGLDFYIEPRWTVDVLLNAEQFTGQIWDPACGSGTILKACADRYGIDRVTGSDIADRGVGGVQDFLDPTFTFVNVDNIISNPPYGLAEAFVLRSLDVTVRKVAMLVQSKFPYSQKRHALFTRCPPARLYFLSTRPSMPPGEKLLAGTVEAKGVNGIVWRDDAQVVSWTGRKVYGERPMLRLEVAPISPAAALAQQILSEAA